MSDPSTLQKLDDAREFMLKNGNMPAPSDPFMTPRFEMSGAHAMILLGLRNIYVVSCSCSLGYDGLKLILVGFASESPHYCVSRPSRLHIVLSILGCGTFKSRP
jgi:hypothetical protein